MNSTKSVNFRKARISFFNPLLRLKKTLMNNQGFSLLELIIVIVIISIMTMMAAPRISAFLSGKRNNMVILTTMIAKTFDDAFLSNKTDFLVVHLEEPDADMTSAGHEIFSRRNGISIIELGKEGTFKDVDNKLLQYREFPSSFKFREVLLSTGETIRRGNVMIPFYPDGHSDDIILHLLINDDERSSVRIFKFKKEARVFADHVSFQND